VAEPAGIAADLAGQASPPRDNGEIVFAAPWERRVFGVAVAWCRSGGGDWESFRQRLIARIGEAPARPYWNSWAAALEDLLSDTGAVAAAEVDERHRAFLARPSGHDHDH
jgi:nitrile hydratase accessory protein